MFEKSFLENIIVNAPLGIVTTDLTGRITFINRLACRIHRLGEPVHIVRKHISTLGNSNPTELMLAFHCVLNNEREKVTVEYCIGKEPKAFIRSTITMLRDENYSPVGVLIMCEDVTEQRILSSVLEREKKFSESIIETANLLIVGIAPDGKIILFNRTAEEMTGYARKDVLNKDWFELFAPADERDNIIRTFYSILDGKIPAYHEHSIIMRNGGRRLIGWHETFLSEIGGYQGGIIAIGEDITEKRKLEEELINERQRLDVILTSLGAGLLLIDRDYTIVYANALVERDFGHSVGKKCFCALHGSLSISMHNGICRDCPAKEIFENNTKQATAEMRGRDGKGGEFWVQLIATPVYDERGVVTGVLELIVPINERKRLEEQLIQAQKMEAVGIIAGGIAHDFNNILSAILGYASLIKSRITADDKNYKYVEMIETGSKHATALAKRLLSFSRRSDSNFEPLNLNELVKNTLDLLHSSLKGRIKVRIEPGMNIPLILGDKTQLEQLIMNIVINARDAMPDGGTLTIKTGKEILDEKFCREHLGAQRGDNAVIVISDTGTGMDEDTRKRIFEPFFTTKKEGKGIGLGLSIAYSVVRNHKGYIDVQSACGKGTSFFIFIPAIKKDDEQTALPAPSEEQAGTILLLEKENSYREKALRILTGRGFKVITASNENEALKMFESSLNAVDLAIIGDVSRNLKSENVLNQLFAAKPGIKGMILLEEENNPKKIKSSLKKYRISSFKKTDTFENLFKTIQSILS